MTYNRSHNRYLRHGRFARVKHGRQFISFLDAQTTRLNGTASSVTFTAKVATGTLTNDGTAVTAADTVTIGSNVYTFVTALTEAKAGGTLTVTAGGNQVANGDTVTIGTKVYTFQTVLTNVDGNVLIGANDTAAMLNLKNAINLGTNGGTFAAAMTLHPTVTATSSTATTCVLAAKALGVAGNAIATTETGAQTSFAQVTLTGGLDSVVGEVLRSATNTVDMTELFEAINAGANAGTHYSTATVAHPDVVATNPSGTTVVVKAKVAGNNSVATTEASTHLSWGATTLTGGDSHKLTATSHGFADYEGPLTLATTGTLPAPLVSDHYWVATPDANTIELANSRDAVIKGDFITITDAGSGTNTILRAQDRQGTYELLRTNKPETLVATADIDNLK